MDSVCKDCIHNDSSVYDTGKCKAGVDIKTIVSQPGFQRIVECPHYENTVDHPSYYQGKIEVIDFIEDKGLGFHLGNAIKYIARAGRKSPDTEVEDLRKAIWYIERYIELREDK